MGKKIELISRSTNTDPKDLNQKLLHYSWKGSKLTKTVYGKIPENIIDIGERVKLMVNVALNSLEYKLITYILPATLLLFFAACLFSFHEQNWYVLVGAIFLFLFSNYAVFDLRRLAISNLSKTIQTETTRLEKRLSKTNFKLDIKLSYGKGGNRRFGFLNITATMELDLVFRNKVFKGDCVRLRKKTRNSAKTGRGIAEEDEEDKQLIGKSRLMKDGVYVDRSEVLIGGDKFEIFEGGEAAEAGGGGDKGPGSEVGKVSISQGKRGQYKVNIDGKEMICYRSKEDIVDNNNKGKKGG